MAAPRKKPESEFIPLDEAERMMQNAAGRALASQPDPEPEPPQYVEDDADEIALANVIADLGGPGIDAKVNVYQLDQNRNKAFVRAFLPTEFSMEAVQSEYGPGDYEIHVRKDGRLATRKVIKIAVPKNQPQNIPAPAMETGKIIESMQNGFKEMGTMFANALAGLAANQPKPKSSMEMLQELQMMRDIMGGNSAPAGPDPMQLFEMATQIAEKITPRTGEPGAGEVILNAIKEFGPVISQAAQNAAANRVAPIQPQNHTQLPAPAATPSPTPEPDPMLFNARKMYLNLLIGNAQADNDPSTYAQLMLDVAGEQAAIEFAAAPDWFEKLCAEEPRATGFKPWFEELRSMVIELTKPEMPEAPLTSAPPPDMNTGNEDQTGM